MSIEALIPKEHQEKLGLIVRELNRRKINYSVYGSTYELLAGSNDQKPADYDFLVARSSSVKAYNALEQVFGEVNREYGFDECKIYHYKKGFCCEFLLIHPGMLDAFFLGNTNRIGFFGEQAKMMPYGLFLVHKAYDFYVTKASKDLDSLKRVLSRPEFINKGQLMEQLKAHPELAKLPELAVFS